MYCPLCGGKTGVCENVLNDKENEMYRRRKCKECGHKFYTLEFVVPDYNVLRDTYNLYLSKHRENLKTKED